MSQAVLTDKSAANKDCHRKTKSAKGCKTPTSNISPEDSKYCKNSPQSKVKPLELKGSALGKFGERISTEFLERRGFEILERNWRCPYGEADIIALDEDVLVFIEVKTRKGSEETIPEVAIDAQKIAIYEKISKAYLNIHPGYEFVRFDALSLTVFSNDSGKIRHITNIHAVEY